MSYMLPVVREHLPHRASLDAPGDVQWAHGIEATPDERTTYIEGIRRAKWRYLDRELNARQAARLPAAE